MKPTRGKIVDVISGSMWRVTHQGRNGTTSGVFDIVGGKDEDEAVAKVRAAYARERVILVVERIG